MFESPSSPQSSDGDVQAPDVPPATDDLEALLARRTSPRRRALRAGLIGLPVLIALVVVVLSFPNALPAWTGIGARATATPALAPSDVLSINSANMITVTSNVTFGTLKLNGKRVAGHMPWQITLVKGDNTVTLTAPPFAPRSCSLRAPLQLSSDNPFAESGQSANAGCSFGWSSGNAPTSMSLDIQLSGKDLSPVLQQRALATVKFALATMPGYTGTVQPGDYYAAGLDANGLPTARRATEPLAAQLSYALADPATTGPGQFIYSCGDPLCPGNSAQAEQVTALVWIVAMPVAQVWRFTTASGEVAGQVAELTQDRIILALSYDPSGWWRISNALDTRRSALRVSPLAYTDPCSAAMQILWQMLNQMQGGPSGLGMHTASARLQGCKLQILDQGGATQVTFIFMFGVLLAADDGAHNFLPSLPMARPSEVASVG